MMINYIISYQLLSFSKLSKYLPHNKLRGTMAGNAPKRPPWLRNCLCSAGASALFWKSMDRWTQVLAKGATLR